MKEAYFTPETIEAAASRLLESCQSARASRPAGSLHPRQAALLVLDMQNYFLEPGSHAFIPAAPAVVPNVLRLVEAFCRLERPVFFTRHLNTPADAGQMARWWRDLIDPASPLSALLPALGTPPTGLIEKTQYDAFYQTGLEAALRAAQVSQVVISGVMTHLCCETTARSAFVRGFQVFFALDATATYTEAFHRAALLNLSHGFAAPLLARQIESVFYG